jgi:hypothetical protein
MESGEAMFAVAGSDRSRRQASPPYVTVTARGGRRRNMHVALRRPAPRPTYRWVRLRLRPVPVLGASELARHGRMQVGAARAVARAVWTDRPSLICLITRQSNII